MTEQVYVQTQVNGTQTMEFFAILMESMRYSTVEERHAYQKTAVATEHARTSTWFRAISTQDSAWIPTEFFMIIILNFAITSATTYLKILKWALPKMRHNVKSWNVSLKTPQLLKINAITVILRLLWPPLIRIVISFLELLFPRLQSVMPIVLIFVKR